MEHKYTFEWTTGSASDNMIRFFREKGIRYEYDGSFRLCACIVPGSAPVPVEYYHITGRLFGITQKPQRTSEYFHLSPRVLLTSNGDGWTKEDCLTAIFWRTEWTVSCSLKLKCPGLLPIL